MYKKDRFGACYHQYQSSDHSAAVMYKLRK